MHTFTKVFLAAVAVILIVFGGWYGYNRYLFNHPDIEITFYTSGEGSVDVFTLPQLSFEPSTKMGVSEEWDNRYFEIQDVIGEMISAAKRGESVSPYFYDSSVEITPDGKTLFTLTGFYTENGVKTDVSQSWSLDYVVTEKIIKGDND